MAVDRQLDEGRYPVEFAVAYPDRSLNRLTTAFRIIIVIPFLIVAGEATPFSTGRYLQLGPALPHNHLLVTLGRAFGADISQFGDESIPAGDLDDKLLAE